MPTPTWKQHMCNVHVPTLAWKQHMYNVHILLSRWGRHTTSSSPSGEGDYN